MKSVRLCCGEGRGRVRRRSVNRLLLLPSCCRLVAVFLPSFCRLFFESFSSRFRVVFEMCGLSFRERLVGGGCLAAENADRDGVQEGGRQACDGRETAGRRGGGGKRQTGDRGNFTFFCERACRGGIFFVTLRRIWDRQSAVYLTRPRNKKHIHQNNDDSFISTKISENYTNIFPLTYNPDKSGCKHFRIINH